MSRDAEPEVTIRCPECETTTSVSLSDVADAVERHNANRHDGDDVAGVDPQTKEHIADLVARDMGLLDE